MKYTITGDANISGKKIGDIIEAEPHAMEIYLQRGQVEVFNEEATTEPVAETPVELATEEPVVEPIVEEVQSPVVETPAETVTEIPVELSENEQIKKELTEKGIDFKGNASTESLKALNV